jgi:hypothetical protein
MLWVGSSFLELARVETKDAAVEERERLAEEGHGHVVMVT